MKIKITICQVICSLAFIVGCTPNETPIIFEQIDTPVPFPIRAIDKLETGEVLAAGGHRYWAGQFLFLNDDEVIKDSIFHDKAIYDLDFLTVDYGFVSCLDGKIFRIKNELTTFERIQLPAWDALYDVDIINDSTIVTVGGINERFGYFYMSNDSGKTWTSDSLNRELRAVHFFDNQNGIAVGFGIVMNTFDGGKSWDSTNIQGDFYIDIEFPTSSTGYILGRNGSLFKTVNGGNDWYNLRNASDLFQPQYYWNDCHFRNAEEGVIAGDKGVLLYTKNGGKEWVKIKHKEKINFYACFFDENGQIWIGGEAGNLYKIML